MTEVKNYLDNVKLGLTYTPDSSTIRVWAPSQDNIKLCLYENYSIQKRTEYEMEKNIYDVFEYTLNGDMEGNFYTFLIGNQEVVDPYSFASSANSKRTAIIGNT